MQALRRQANFELLRILAMIGVVCNHFFNALDIYSGFKIDVTTTTGLLVYTLLQVIKLAALPSVNCYILVSGYFLIDNPTLRKRGIWRVWSETWFYSVAIWIAFLCCSRTLFSWHDALGYLFPVSTNEFWFITSYLFLMMLAPFLSKLAMLLDHNSYTLLLIVGFFICFEYPFGRWLVGGNMLLLFIYLFLTGGYIRRFYSGSQSTWKTLLSILFLLTVMFAYCTVKNIYKSPSSFSIFSMAYNGLVMPLSVCVFLWFKNIRIEGTHTTAIINSLASLSLSVYIIHEHPLIRQLLWGRVHQVLLQYPLVDTPLICIITCMIVYAACTTIDWVRHQVVYSSKLFGA